MTNIGVFDSGLGGIAVLNELAKKNDANFYYLGDNLRVPYGNRPKEEIKKFAIELVTFLERFDIDFYIIACNTISVTCKDYLIEHFKKKFIAITDMAVEASLECDGDYLALATKATISSHYIKNKIEAKKDATVYEMAALKLVDLIEEGYLEGPDLDEALREYLYPANDKALENIILGCTHYPLIKDQIQKNLTCQANIIDPAIYLADKLDLGSGQKGVNIFMTKKSAKTERLIDQIMEVDYKLNYLGDIK